MRTTPDICDDFPNDIRILAPIFKSYGAISHFGGQVITVKCYEDNSFIKSLSAEQGNRRILVVDGGGSLKKALLGDLIAADFVSHGWAGVVIHGCVRDVEILKTLPLGIRAVNSIPLKTARKGQGEQGIPLCIAGVTVNTGDYMVADDTGIVVSDRPIHL